MPAIPRLIRQQGIPGTTGVSPLTFDPTQDFITPAMENVTGVFQKIGDDLFKAESEAALSTANTNAALKLNALEAELAAGDPATAFGTYESRVREIQQESNAALGSTSPLVQQAFSKKFMELATNSAIKIRGTATKGRYKELEAALITELDTLEKLAGTGEASDRLISDGVDLIETAVRNNIIDPDAGAKLIIKFKQNVSENIVTGFINSRTLVGVENTLMDALTQMEEGEFQNPLVTAAWKNLEEPKKATFMRRAVEVLSRSLTFKDKEDRRKERLGDQEVRGLAIEFINPKTSPERHSEIIKELSLNDRTTPALFQFVLDRFSGVTKGLENRKAIKDITLLIIRAPELVTYEMIVAANPADETFNRLLSLLEGRKDKEMAKAADILNAADVFIPDNFADASLMKDVFNDAQAKIYLQLMEEAQRYHRLTPEERKVDQGFFGDGVPFNPVEMVLKLITQYEEEQQKSAMPKSRASAYLKRLGIESRAAVQDYIDDNVGGSDGLSMEEITKINEAANTLWPQ